MRKYIISLFIFTEIFSGCKNSDNLNKLIFPAGMEKTITFNTVKDRFIVYYYSSDCSICYGTILFLSNEFQDLPIVCISPSIDTAILNHYLKGVIFDGVILNDNDSAFYKNNKSVLLHNRLFFTDTCWNIIFSSTYPDSRFIHKMKKYFRDKIKQERRM